VRRGMQFVGIIVLALIVGAGAVLFRYGTITPCGILRVQVREQAARSGGAQGFITGAISDNLLDTLLASRYGPLTPGRCLSLVFSREPVTIGPPER
jgi:hypothetical protein